MLKFFHRAVLATDPRDVTKGTQRQQVIFFLWKLCLVLD